MNRAIAVPFLLLITAVLPATPALAQNCSPGTYSSGVFGIGSNISVSPGSGWGSVCASCEITSGMEYWNVCSGQGSAFASMGYQSSGAQVSVSINFHPGTSTDTSAGCGRVESWNFTPDGQITDATIGVFERDSNGTPCSPYSDTVAHELGHVLGLANAPTECNGTGAIMSTRPQYYDNGTLRYGTRSVASSDCQTADAMWWVSSQESAPPCTARDCTPPPPADPYCDAYCWTSCDSYGCPSLPPCWCSPVLIDLDDNGFDLTGAAQGVTFDIDADGAPDHISWTSPSGTDAFLVLDRNANGRVDDGAELFGTSTPLTVGSRAPNGYVALQEFDTEMMGGNANGTIDAGDAIWDRLQLWVDANHDGVSNAGELVGVESAGLVEISTKYVRNNRTDQHGNVFRFKAKAIVRDKHGRPHSANTYDVFFTKND